MRMHAIWDLGLAVVYMQELSDFKLSMYKSHDLPLYLSVWKAVYCLVRITKKDIE